jgi:transcriptional regulator with XRE-family HTH domain
VDRLESCTRRGSWHFCYLALRASKPKSPKYPKELKTLGDHIRKRRLDIGLLQKQVAAQVGVDTTTVFNWESNATSPQIHVLPQVIRFLGYNPLPAPESLAGRLVLTRKLLMGLTQQEMAKRLRIDPTTLGRIERGEESEGVCQNAEKARRLHTVIIRFLIYNPCWLQSRYLKVFRRSADSRVFPQRRSPKAGL